MTLCVIFLILFTTTASGFFFWLSEDTPWYFDFRYLSEKCQSRQNIPTYLYTFSYILLITLSTPINRKVKQLNNTYNICTKELTKAGVVVKLLSALFW